MGMRGGGFCADGDNIEEVCVDDDEKLIGDDGLSALGLLEYLALEMPALRGDRSPSELLESAA
jgi:hypothetical protein